MILRIALCMAVGLGIGAAAGALEKRMGRRYDLLAYAAALAATLAIYSVLDHIGA